jgi:peptidylprolyl isomerase
MRRIVLFLILALGLAWGKAPVVVLKTNQGDITLKLFPKAAPLAVENFTKLAQKGYYDGTVFHRVIKGFMIQGGDPTGTGRGGQSIWGKEFKNEYAPNLVFDRPYLLAMANRGPNTNGSQFFITVAPAPWLNGGYTIFGEVVKGQKVVDRIDHTPTGPGDRPLSEQKILKAIVK